MADESTSMTTDAPKRRGRPPGSKNKATSGAGNATATAAPKRRGRPPGSKNKPKAGAKVAPKAAKGGSDGANMMDALLKFMKSKPNAVFADAKAAVAKGGHTLYPISWGRAQMLLGRVKVKARGLGKAAMNVKAPAPAAAVAPVKRGPGRPPTAATAARTAPTRAPSGSSGASIAVAAADIPSVKAFVDAANGGGRVELRYAGDGWALSVAS